MRARMIDKVTYEVELDGPDSADLRKKPYIQHSGVGLDGVGFKGIEDLGDAIRQAVAMTNDDTRSRLGLLRWEIGPGTVRIWIEHQSVVSQ